MFVDGPLSPRCVLKVERSELKSRIQKCPNHFPAVINAAACGPIYRHSIPVPGTGMLAFTHTADFLVNICSNAVYATFFLHVIVI